MQNNWEGGPLRRLVSMKRVAAPVMHPVDIDARAKATHLYRCLPWLNYTDIPVLGELCAAKNRLDEACMASGRRWITKIAAQHGTAV
jgi:hypothetical protein